MLNEQILEKISGGKPFIELIGQFISAMFPTRFGSFGGSVARYEAHDDMGQRGHVDQARFTYQPPLANAFGIDKGVQHVTIVNSDNMRDLNGCKLYVAEKHTLPPALVSAVEKASLNPIHSGANVHGVFGVAIPDSVKGTEISIKVPGDPDAKLTVSKTSDKSSPFARFTSGGNIFGVNLSAGISLTEAKVETIDRMANDSYLRMQEIIRQQQEMIQQQQQQQQTPWGANVWSQTY